MSIAFGVGLLGTILVFSGEAPKPRPIAAVSATDTIRPIERTRVSVQGTTIPRTPAPLAETTRSAVEKPQRIAVRVFACTTASQGFLSLLEKEFESEHRDLDLTITTRTDRDCIDFLLMHDADVAIVGSPLSLNERSRGLQQTTLGHFLAAAVVHPSNRVESVTIAQLENLRTGRATTWVNLGGTSMQVQPVCGQPTRLDDFAGRSLRFTDKAAGLTLRMRYPREILGYVANEPRALGLVPWLRAQNDRTVRVLEIHNAKPSVAGLLNGSWPLGATLRVVTKGKVSGGVRRLQQFLDTPRARRVLRETLVLPD